MPDPPLTPYDGLKQHRPGRVVITRLMYRIQQIDKPNYVVAGILDIHPTTLSRYARGREPISAKHLVQFCRILQCEPEDILGTVEVEVEGEWDTPTARKRH